MKRYQSQSVNKDYKHSDITGDIIGCAMRVHSGLGPGYPEVIYQRAMAHEMGKASLSFSREINIPVMYDGVQVGIRRADFIVKNTVVLELKAISEMDKGNFNQVLNYLEAYKKEIGLLINFGTESLQFKRLILTRNKNT
ncbi:MAG: GxxExxY protein [Gracilimonas sp.]|nr:GxxExxY protein [Gracilimonas sp.]